MRRIAAAALVLGGLASACSAPVEIVTTSPPPAAVPVEEAGVAEVPETTVVPERSPADTPEPNTGALRIGVTSDGSVSVNGDSVTVEQAIEMIAGAPSADTKVCYYREASDEEPHPNALAVLDAIIAAELPILFSTEPDFSTSVGPDGQIGEGSPDC